MWKNGEKACIISLDRRRRDRNKTSSRDKPELVEQGAGLITAKLGPAALEGCIGGPGLRFRLCPELPELPGFELADLSTVIPGVAGSTLTRGLLFDISVACFRTWYI
jgi:hypothetical protein